MIRALQELCKEFQEYDRFVITTGDSVFIRANCLKPPTMYENGIDFTDISMRLRIDAKYIEKITCRKSEYEFLVAIYVSLPIGCVLIIAQH